MNNLSQKIIEDYLLEKQVPKDKKEKVILAITDTLYQRNQNVIKMEKEKDKTKCQQFLRSVKEYDNIMDSKTKEILDGQKIDNTYDF
ncbi:MAG: hypothetical protein ABIJ91_02635 [Candidatus Kuenenbacteria bacterium]